MKVGVHVGGTFFVETSICDSTGAVPKLKVGQSGCFHKISVDNGSTLPMDVVVEGLLPNGVNYLGFVPQGTSTPAASWSDTIMRLQGNSDKACDLKALAAGDERVQCPQIKHSRSGTHVPPQPENLNLQIRIKVEP
jgi:hypothetical protein